MFKQFVVAVLFTCLSFRLEAAISEVRSMDGTGNNIANPSWGAIHSPLMRLSPISYPDGRGDVIVDWGNPRFISNTLSAYSGPISDARNLSSMIWQWGQFLDHDISLTESDALNGEAPIMVNEATDPLAPMIPFNRSNFVDGMADGVPRQQINQITTYIDGSNVYSSGESMMESLRSYSDGQMTVIPDDLMPTDESGSFMGGDIRANEQLGLLAMHTLFMREHNRVASRIAMNAADLPVDPTLRDEDIFQRARKIVGAEIQAITYREFLPALIGPYAPALESAEYDPSVNPTITNEFSTVLYRFGHSMLNPDLPVVDNEGNLLDSIPLRDAFFRPDKMLVNPMLMDGILKGLTMQAAQKVDVEMIDDVRSFLFGDGGPGLDLAALNIQRSRDHGIGDYNSVRVAFGLPAASSFADITSDPDFQAALATAYVDIDHIDSWIAALGEDHLPNSSLGELATIAIVDQFTRLRDGDRFFYRFDPDIQQLMVDSGVNLDNLRLSDVIANNTSISNLRDNVFFVPEPHGSVFLLIAVVFACRRRRNCD